MVTEMERTNIRLKDYITGVNEKAERRYFAQPLKFAEVETNGAKSVDENTIEGYAAVFNKDSEDFGGWVESIDPGAFTDVLQDDAVALFNHSLNLVLGRNKVNVVITQDDIGLFYRVNLPGTTLANDIRALVKANIINKSSFAFTVKEERFIKGAEGQLHRRIIVKIETLYDVSPVTYPAYPDTSVASRGFEKNKGLAEINAALSRQKQKLGIIHRYNKHSFSKSL